MAAFRQPRQTNFVCQKNISSVNQVQIAFCVVICHFCFSPFGCLCTSVGFSDSMRRVKAKFRWDQFLVTSS